MLKDLCICLQDLEAAKAAQDVWQKAMAEELAHAAASQPTSDAGDSVSRITQSLEVTEGTALKVRHQSPLLMLACISLHWLH